MSIFDKVADGLDKIGRKTQQAFDEGKLRMDLGRVRRRKDTAARDLGILTYRQAKGEDLNPAAMDTLIRRIDSANDEIAAIEAEIAKVRGEAPAKPAEPPAESPPAETPPAQPETPPTS